MRGEPHRGRKPFEVTPQIARGALSLEFNFVSWVSLVEVPKLTQRSAVGTMGNLPCATKPRLGGNLRRPSSEA